MKHWSFKSTNAEFDGARIQRECRAAGLEIVTIRRREKTVTLVTREYYARMVRAGISDGVLQAAFVGYGLELRLNQKGEMYVCGGIPDQYAQAERYHYPLGGSVDAGLLHEELLKAEARMERTTVVGCP